MFRHAFQDRPPMTSTVAFYTSVNHLRVAHLCCNEVYDSLISSAVDVAIYILGVDLDASSSTSLYVRSGRSETMHVDRV